MGFFDPPEEKKTSVVRAALARVNAWSSSTPTRSWLLDTTLRDIVTLVLKPIHPEQPTSIIGAITTIANESVNAIKRLGQVNLTPADDWNIIGQLDYIHSGTQMCRDLLFLFYVYLLVWILVNILTLLAQGSVALCMRCKHRVLAMTAGRGEDEGERI